MKKILLLLVAVGGLLTACNNEGSEWIEVDYSQDLVGTWTCLEENFAQAFIFNADGTAITAGVENGAYWEDVQVTWTVKNNKLTLSYGENVSETHFEIIAGEMLSIADKDGDRRRVFQYCKEDLADEIIGMWVSNDGVAGMAIQIYQEDGKSIYTGFSYGANDYMVNKESTYKVVGDLMFQQIGTMHFVTRLTYLPNGNALGDILNTTATIVVNNEPVTSSYSFLRIRQSLELENQKYDYSNIYITNVKAKDAEFEFAGQTLNLATMDGKFLDKMLKNILFNVSFPTSNEIVYNCYYNGQSVSMPAPIVVEGNKMTIKKSAKNPVYKDIDVWTFQDQDNTQMHMYMPTYTFENFLANTIVEMMANDGKLDLNDAEAVAAIYDAVAEAIETINVSFIFKDATRAL